MTLRFISTVLLLLGVSSSALARDVFLESSCAPLHDASIARHIALTKTAAERPNADVVVKCENDSIVVALTDRPEIQRKIALSLKDPGAERTIATVAAELIRLPLSSPDEEVVPPPEKTPPSYPIEISVGLTGFTLSKLRHPAFGLTVGSVWRPIDWLWIGADLFGAIGNIDSVVPIRHTTIGFKPRVGGLVRIRNSEFRLGIGSSLAWLRLDPEEMADFVTRPGNFFWRSGQLDLEWHWNFRPSLSLTTAANLGYTFGELRAEDSNGDTVVTGPWVGATLRLSYDL